MENQLNVGDQNTQPVGQNPVVQPTVLDKPRTNFTAVLAVGLVCSLVFGFGGYFLGKQSLIQTTSQNQPTPTENSDSIVNPTSLPMVSPSTTGSLIKQIGLQYTLPSSLNKFGVMTEQIIPGEKGNQLCLTFPQKTSWLVKTVHAGGAHCPIVHFGFGTTSINFEAGRSGGFTDFQGFEIVDGKYFGVFPLGKLIEIPTDIMEVIKNPNGITIVKINGKKYDVGGGMTPFLYEGSVGALINVSNNSNYRGITLQLELTDGSTDQEFDQILSSLKFVN
jgi:hypothetical protein